MKIALVHNKYGVFSGEEAVVENQISILKSKGMDVCLFERSSEEINNISFGRIKAFFSGIYNPFSAGKIKKFLLHEKPDIIHIHNLFPFISPSILPVCRKMKIPVVMTVHNFRLLCPNGLFYTHGEICEKCAAGKEFYCIKYNCLGNYPKSIGYCLRNFVARKFKLYINNVVRFIVLSEFQKSKLVAYGYPSEKILVIPNMYMGEKGSEKNDFGEYVLFAGRFNREKGIDVMFEVAKTLPEIPFMFVGSGYKKYEKDKPENVTLSDYLEKARLEHVINKSRIIIMASGCYEGFPMGILDAISHYKPIVVPNRGIFAEFVNEGKCGLLYEPENVVDFADKIKVLWNDRKKCLELGHMGYEMLRDRYSDTVYYRKIVDLYNDVLSEY